MILQKNLDWWSPEQRDQEGTKPNTLWTLIVQMCIHPLKPHWLAGSSYLIVPDTRVCSLLSRRMSAWMAGCYKYIRSEQSAWDGQGLKHELIQQSSSPPEQGNDQQSGNPQDWLPSCTLKNQTPTTLCWIKAPLVRVVGLESERLETNNICV